MTSPTGPEHAHEVHESAGDGSVPVDVVIVTLRFDAADAAALGAVLSQYVVQTRRLEGCRNVDFCALAGSPSTFVIIEKWTSESAQRAHLDDEVMVTMARSCAGLLRNAPQIDLLETISAHDQH